MQIEPESIMIQKFVAWGENQPLVRAMLLTSTRALPNHHPDLLSDYDLVLVVTDVSYFAGTRHWLPAFGQVLAAYCDPLEYINGYAQSGNVVQFDGGLKIDFTFLAVELFQQIVAAPQLPDEYDAGYRLLLDKDRLADGLRPPTFQAFIPRPPSADQYQAIIENFMLDSLYMAKFLWRDDLVAARHLHESCMLQENLLAMLTWHFELEHAWSVKPGPYGRGLKKWLRPDLWNALAATYTGPDPTANWQALFDTFDLMCKTAQEVGEQLGFAFPSAMAVKTRTLLEEIRCL